jgi:hypothetical protein
MVKLACSGLVHDRDHSTWQIEGRPWAMIRRMYRYTVMRLGKNSSRWIPVGIAGLDAVAPVAVATADFHPTSQLTLCNNPDPTYLCYSEGSELAIKSVELHQMIQWDSKPATIMRKEDVVASWPGDRSSASSWSAVGDIDVDGGILLIYSLPPRRGRSRVKSKRAKDSYYATPLQG